MRREFRTMAVVACLGAASALGAQMAAAHPGAPGGKQELGGDQRHKGPRGGEHFRKMAKELGLTEQQKSQAKALREGMRAQNQELFGTLRADKRELRAMIHSGSAEEAALRAQAAKVAAAEADLAVRKAQGAKQFLALLTPEQVKKFKELQAKREAKREGMFGRFGACEEGEPK
jgi:periplasmic protein CpxP/Spy